MEIKDYNFDNDDLKYLTKLARLNLGFKKKNKKLVCSDAINKLIEERKRTEKLYREKEKILRSLKDEIIQLDAEIRIYKTLIKEEIKEEEKNKKMCNYNINEC